MEIWAAAAGVAIGAAGLGLSASGALQPTVNQPNLASSSRELSNAEASLLPLQRGMEAAAQKGGKFTFQLPAGVDGSTYGFNNLPQGQTTAQEQQVFVPNQASTSTTDTGSNTSGGVVSDRWGATGAASPNSIQTGAGQWVAYNPDDFKTGGKYAGLGQPQLRTVTNNNGTYTVDFNGYGAGQVQGNIAKQQAANQLALAQKYDPQFIAAALAQEKEADPQSFAARARENELIQQQITAPPENPVANLLSDQVESQLRAGKGLDDFDQSTLNDAVAKSLAARGGNGAGADFSQPLTTGAAGVARQQAGIQKGIGELSSGSSPEDISYRREQQNLANLSALMSGQTPTSQFKSLSGAQSGPTPNVSGPSLSQVPNGQAATAGNAAIATSGITNQLNASQANPWMAGLSTLLAAGNAAGGLGFKPFAMSGPNG